MTDDVKALIARVQVELESYDEESLSTDVYTFDQWRLLYDVKVALEAATVAPAVDREAAVREYVTGDYYRLANQGDSAMLMNSMLDALLASGILRDVRDVQAEALEQAADDHEQPDPAGRYELSGWLRARAQAIREAHNE